MQLRDEPLNVASVGLSQSEWARLLARWSTVPPSPERRLACAVIASGINEELRDAKKRRRPPFVHGEITEPLRIWCAFIGIQWQFVLDRISDCNAVDIQELRRELKTANALRA